MALDKITLKRELKRGLVPIFSNPRIVNNVETICEQLSTLLANKIDDYTKTGNATGTDSRGDIHNLKIQ